MATHCPRVAVVGNINMDAVIRVEQFPSDGQTLLGSALKWVPGGKAANQAVAAARLGADVTVIGCVGQDAFGDRLLDSLRDAGVDTHHVRRTSADHTGTAVVMVREDGQNAIVSCLGANLRFRPDEVRECAGSLLASDAVLVQLGVPLPTVEAVIDMCAEGGVPCFLDLSPIRSGPPRNWRRAALISPNQTEGRVVLGGRCSDAGAEPESVAKLLVEEGAARVALKLGAQGCAFHDGRDIRRVSAPEVAVVDTTGAGDAFLAALAVGFVESQDWDRAVRMACCAGTLACTHEGAQPSLPSRRDVEQLMADRGT
jgi:ribokinase